jgi:hypothetical protein
MEPIFDTYPVFDANQVLTSKHLNNVFGYLDQQNRLTRSRLIGIGIVCGLEIKLAGNTIFLSKGCGVTSEGYLILEPEDVTLVAYRPYAMPSEWDYAPFKDASHAQYPMWELFAAGEPNTTPLDSPAMFLEDKGVVLFLELNKHALRNCSPNNCDDKGSEITATVRRLLVRRQHLDKIIAAASALGTDLTADDLDAALSAKFNLPDVKVPRFDVPSTNPVSSADVYAAFLQVFGRVKLATSLADALTASYDAFKPLLEAIYASNPFANFAATYGFLDNNPTTTTQVRFLQYYLDLFEDLVRAYDEFRWKGADLICACCPADGLFPRHLMLGLLRPELVSNPQKYRHTFLPSPAIGRCGEESKTIVQLFRRLVEMELRFTNAPSLPQPNDKARIDPQIRVTPSVLGDKATDKRAIPYYYRQTGVPPLYQLWSVEQTHRNRANQNLGFRSDEYDPVAPAFVSDPLRFDMEPYNFLRVEGHLGKNYQHVLSSLLALRSDYRLAIDVIALRTGAYDDTQAVDSNSESAYFQDLEALYDSLREQLLASLAEGAMDLYDVPVSGSEAPEGTPTLPLLRKYEPHYRYPKGSVGAFYEANMNRFSSAPYIDVDQTKFSDPAFSGEVLKVYCTLFIGLNGLPPENFAHVVSIFYFSKLAEILPQRLDALGYADFENKYQDLLALVRFFRSEVANKVPSDLKSFVPRAQLIEQFDQVLYSCKVEAVKSVYDAYKSRLSELKKMQFLSSFLQRHPGVQHKAGVPVGGTFILVYHATPPRRTGPSGGFATDLTAVPEAAFMRQTSLIADLASTTSETTARRINDAIDRISANAAISRNPDVDFLIGSLTGRIPETVGAFTLGNLPEDAANIITTAVGELKEGDIIADFYLPYKVFGDIPGIQFVLPKTPPSLEATIAGMTNENRLAPVKVEVKGGVAPYELSVDNGPYQALEETVMLLAGTRILRARDSEATESNDRSITIPEPITFGTPEFACEEGMFTARVPINGGTPPYTVNGTAIADNVFTTPATISGGEVVVEVVDSANATAKTTLSHECPPPCDLPCSGLALRRGYRFWLPEAEPNAPYRILRLEEMEFNVESSPGNVVDLTPMVRPIIEKIKPTAVNTAGITKVITTINNEIAKVPELNDGNTTWLSLRYESLGAGRLGTLWIEYFQCLTFRLRVTETFARPEKEEKVNAIYTPDGTVLETADAPLVIIPPFEGEEIDKCQPGMPETPICKTPPRIRLNIERTGSTDRSVTFTVIATPASGELQFLWEIQGATPPMGSGPTFTTQLPPANTASLISVTAFTRAGCSVTFATTIDRV